MNSCRWNQTVTLALIAVSMAAFPAMADLEESRTLERSFELAAGGRLVIDNVFGSIRVTGSDRSSVHMKAVETIRADDEEALERARREVELVAEGAIDLVDLYVDGPFRDRRRHGWSRHHREPRYRVSYDFVLEVPRGIVIELSTVTDGEISVVGVHGDFDVKNVNGGIEMRDLRGSGSIHTVNGPITADFSRSPRSVCDFKTVNGKVEVFFPDDLSADLELITRWGELWSEFEVAAIPVPPVTRRTKAGKTVIKSGGPLLRVADGGPRLSFETLNGDVLIRRHEKGESQ